MFVLSNLHFIDCYFFYIFIYLVEVIFKSTLVFNSYYLYDSYTKT